MKYKPYRASKMHTLDYRRAEEKITVHYFGEAARLVSINRACMLVDAPEQIGAVAEQLAAGLDEHDSEIIAILNRFAAPAPTGYRDLKALIRDKSTGHISTFRVVHADYDETTFFQSAQSSWNLRQIATRVAIGDIAADRPVVIVSDNYLRDDEHSVTAVYGFTGDTEAWQYAISRFKDGIRVLADEAVSTQDLKYSWLVYGEDVAILIDGQLHYLSPDLMAYILQIRISDFPYWRIEESCGLKKAPVAHIDPDTLSESG